LQDRQVDEKSDEFAEFFRQVEGQRVILSGGFMWTWDEFVEHVRQTKLNKRERTLLRKLGAFGLDPVPRDVTAGIDTLERLEARGYLIVDRPEPNRVFLRSLTSAGLDAYRGLQED
jgi:hypothetical protein